jgi:hypothetical protein
MTRHPGGRTCNGILTKPIVWLVYAAAFLLNLGRRK